MNIYVRNLSPTTTRQELIECFEEFGSVTDSSISLYTVEGKDQASGFVEMPSNEHGRAAINGLQGRELAGKVLTIQGE